MARPRYPASSISKDLRAGREPGKLFCDERGTATVHNPKEHLGAARERAEGKTCAITILSRSYERFLELPVAIVLAGMWVAGAAALGSAMLALYVLIGMMGT